MLISSTNKPRDIEEVCWCLTGRTSFKLVKLVFAQWPKSVDESEFVGTGWNSCFSDQNMYIIDSRLEFKSFSRAEF